jgi:ankyrin repeat protein
MRDLTLMRGRSFTDDLSPLTYITIVCDQDGKTALYVAVEKGCEDIISLLLDRGANIDIASVVSESHLCSI